MKHCILCNSMVPLSHKCHAKESNAINPNRISERKNIVDNSKTTINNLNKQELRKTLTQNYQKTHNNEALRPTQSSLGLIPQEVNHRSSISNRSPNNSKIESFRVEEEKKTNLNRVSSNSEYLEKDKNIIIAILEFLLRVPKFRNKISTYHDSEDYLLYNIWKYSDRHDDDSIFQIMHEIELYSRSDPIEFIDIQNALILFLNVLHLQYLNSSNKENCGSNCISHKFFGFKQRLKFTCNCKQTFEIPPRKSLFIHNLKIDKQFKLKKLPFITMEHPNKLDYCNFGCSNQGSLVDINLITEGDYLLVNIEYYIKFSNDFYTKLTNLKGGIDNFFLFCLITKMNKVFEIEKDRRVYIDVLEKSEINDILEYFKKSDDEPIILLFQRY